MCGIFLSLFSKQIKFNKNDYKFLFEHLLRRGPDFNRIIEEYDLIEYKAYLLSSVLDLRGDHLVEQPIIKGNDFLQFNGELYEIVNDTDFGKINDGIYLIDRLINCNGEQEIFKVISDLRGEFSFVYFSSKLRTLFFGRDYFGRRSLCWNIDSKFYLQTVKETDLNKIFIDESSSLKINHLDYNFCISSVANYDDQRTCWTEIPAIGVFKISFNRNHVDFEQIKVIRWLSNNSAFSETLFLYSPITNPFNFDLLDKIEEEAMLNYVSKFLKLLQKSVEKRVLKQNFKCKKCSSTALSCKDHSCLAVLFSGGLDSTILALIADQFMPKSSPIDLINLTFNNDAPDRKTGWLSYLELKKLAPDRKWNFVAVDKTHNELIEERERIIKRVIYPLKTVLDDSIGCAMYFASEAKGRLIQDNLGKLKEFHFNELDLQNISNPNELINQYPSIVYESTSKVVLLGQGADEQLSGYERHRIIFRKGGWSALQSEINLDVNRISYRNLGRDDRVISSNGRESRYPFLDENVVNFLNSLPTNVKCDLNLPNGEGDKRLLRLVAKKLGLEQCCRYEKRAIQFGSKIAKLENKKEKAHNISEKLI